MDFNFFDFIGLTGVFFYLLSYLLLNLKKVTGDSLSYILMNLLGACLLLVSLIESFNLASFVTQSIWILISILGIYNYFKKKNEEKL